VRQFKSTYILIICLLGVLSCKITRNIPDGKYLLKKNKIELSGEGLDEDDINDIIKQQPNYRSVGLRLKLRAYNAVDSSNVAKKRIRKNDRIDKINLKKKAKEKRINQRRIVRARKNNQDYYTNKKIELKDTLNPRLFFREWLKYKYGEPPVIFDSSYFDRSVEQLNKFLKRKGYYEAGVSGEVIPKGKRKVRVDYHVDLGPRFIIDSTYFIGSNASVKSTYRAALNNQEIDNLNGKPFDREMLDDYRNKVAKLMRDKTYYGFSPTHISYLADTNSITRTVTIGIQFNDRVVYSETTKDSVYSIPHRSTKVRNVYFHINDTNTAQGNFTNRARDLGFNLYQGASFVNLDTLDYAQITVKGNRDSLDKTRMVTFFYNGEMFVDPAVLECQNYLEETDIYKEYYVDRSYSHLLQLGLFQSIKPEVTEIEGTNLVDVHYYLVPSKKQSYSFEPRATNSNGFFGVSASVNYFNKNLFGGAQRLTISLSGGFESQPPVFDPNIKDELIEQANRSFNTFEIGPSFIYDIPGLFPSRISALSKRHRPRTIISSALNFQQRSEFTKSTFQANYLYKMFVTKTQIFQYGAPFLSVIKYVNITKSEAFDQQINQFNDLFLRNAYSDQLIWQDWKFNFEYNNKDKDNPITKSKFYYNGSFDPAGNFISAFKSFQDTNEIGRYEIFGVPYTRFVRLDNDLIVSRRINKKTSVHFRSIVGAGIPTGNKETSLPFDYSFFAGGSNDNRGWRARSLGPGAYKYILDTARTLTQIGDVRIAASFEYRFSLGQILKMAVFTDAGNVWTMKEDVNRPGSQFSNTWFKEIAYSAGLGFRFDLDFLIVRLDVGFKLNNHTLPEGSRWFYQSRDAFEQELLDTFGADDLKRLRLENKIPVPFGPEFHFGIGYPF
jgi:outer membrane protein insertion porin family